MFGIITAIATLFFGGVACAIIFKIVSRKAPAFAHITRAEEGTPELSVDASYGYRDGAPAPTAEHDPYACELDLGSGVLVTRLRLEKDGRFAAEGYTKLYQNAQFPFHAYSVTALGPTEDLSLKSVEVACEGGPASIVRDALVRHVSVQREKARKDNELARIRRQTEQMLRGG